VDKSFGILRPETALPSFPARGRAGIELLAGWVDPRHALLLRALLDAPESEVRLPGCSAPLQRVGMVLEGLRRDARLAYAEFREKWVSRLDAEALVHFLERGQWFVPHPRGGVALIGRGSRKEARMLYLQTLHDMATDCARQWASLGGRLQAFQTSFAADWHRESVSGNETRVLPALEAAFRNSEFEAWKSLRLSLGEIGEEAFVSAVGRWENRSFPDPVSLVRGIAAPWRHLDPGGNGFIGFSKALSQLAENLALAMLEHYDRKWELFLRGFSGNPTPS
jgi:hypothetical protein